MQTVTLKFDVSGQNLIAGDLTRYASNTVNYVKAVFDLDGNWNSFDSVRAVWSTDFECISTVLDSEGVCYVPQEVLKRTGNVMVNLVGSIAENDELTDRLTTYPVVALVINANAKVCGTETAEVTPSQFEQYVAMVVAEVEKVTGMTATAVALPEGSAPTAVYENGVLTLGIPKGDKGETGNGISSVEFNADYSLTFNFTESEPYTTPSIRGERGAHGYGIVSVEKIGTAGLVDTYQVNYEDSSVPPTTFTVTNGAKGDTGNGISSVTKTGTVGLVDTYRITFTNGGHYDFNVTNGAKGDTGATGNGIATIAKTSTSGLVDTYTITFTDGTSTTFEVTNGQDGEVTYDELSELLPTETASGDIASFNDGQAVIPAVSCVADIDPIQDLHGYDAPWVGGAGKNKLDPTLVSVFTATTYGLTTTWNATKGCVTFSGTFTGSSSSTEFSCLNVPNAVRSLDVSGFSSSNNFFKFRWQAGEDVLVIGLQNMVNGSSYNFDVYPIIYSGTAPTAWTPYENICPITGWTGCEVDVAGVNQWDEVWELGDLNTNTGADYPATDRIRSKNYVPIFPNTVYYNACGKNIVVCFYDANKSFIAPNIIANANTTFTTPANSRYLRFYVSPSYGTTYKNDISINYPSTDTTYHAHNPNSAVYPVSWQTEAGTVYGGTLDLVSGVLTVTHGIVDFGTRSFGTATANGRTSASLGAKTPLTGDDTSGLVCSAYTAISPQKWYGSELTGVTICGVGYGGNGNVGLCDPNYANYTTAQLQTALNGVMLVYPLATPTTYQLTPQQIDTLKGQNNITATSGKVSVTYKADIQKYIDNAIATFA